VIPGTNRDGTAFLGFGDHIAWIIRWPQAPRGRAYDRRADDVAHSPGGQSHAKTSFHLLFLDTHAPDFDLALFNFIIT